MSGLRTICKYANVQNPFELVDKGLEWIEDTTEEWIRAHEHKLAPKHLNMVYCAIKTGAQNTLHDGIVDLLVSIDGILAISIGEVRSGWNKWIQMIYSFGIKCDNASHNIEIRADQLFSEVFQLFPKRQIVFRET